MTEPQTVNLAPAEAANQVRQELQRASDILRSDDLDGALDRYVHALGLALQLGPAPTEQVLASILDAAHELAGRHHAGGLAALGPALVDLVAQVRRAGALPPTAIMEAWAVVALDLGTLIGQIGLALTLAQDHREGMMDNARTRALLLDDATDNLFDLSSWLDLLYKTH